MKKHFSLSLLLMVSALLLTGCASSTDSNDNGGGGNNGPSVPVGTVRVKLDGTLKNYTTTVSTFNAADTVFSVEAADPDNVYSRFRIFIYNPRVGTFPVEKADRQGEVALIQAVTGVGAGPTFIAHSGTLKMTKREGKSYAGTFSFTASADGTTNGTQVQGTEGEFNLETLF